MLASAKGDNPHRVWFAALRARPAAEASRPGPLRARRARLPCDAVSKSPRTSAGRLSPVAWIALLVAAGVLVSLVFWSGGADAGPSRWGETMRLMAAGRVGDARAALADMRRTWARDDAAKNRRLDGVAHDLDRIDQLVAEGRKRIRDEAATRSQLDQFSELDQLRKQRPDEPEGIAARLLLAQLADLRLDAPQVLPDAPAAVAAGSESSPSPPEAPSAPRGKGASGSPAAPAAPAERPSSIVADQLAAVAKKRDAGDWNEAAELLRLAREASGPADATAIDTATSSLRRALRIDLDQVLMHVRQAAAGGTVKDVDKALALTAEAIERFPTGFAFDSLDTERSDLQRLRQRLVAAPPALAGATSEEDASRNALAEVRALEREGDFAGAAERLTALADAARKDDPAFAAQLDARRAELALLGEFADALLEHAPVAMRLREKGPVTLSRTDDGRVVAETEGTPVVFDWPALDPASIAAFCKSHKLSPRELAGAGALVYRTGDVAGAEALLGQAVTKDASLQEAVNPVIAHGRGELATPDGYRFEDGRFITMRDVRVAARAKELTREVHRLLGRPEPERDAAIEEIAGRGADEVEALVVALRDEARHVADQLDKDAFRKQWEAVAEQRRALDDARAHALALIFDTVKYFYPYKPPAVTAEKAAEYPAVQREVDARVAHVLDVWDSGQKAHAVPKRVRDRLADVEWLLTQLQGFGEPLRGLESEIDWARALPPDRQPLDVQSFCWDPHERADRDEWEHIERFNAKKLPALNPGERTLVRITNGYREMLGRAPLIVNAKLCASARGHAKEMSEMGYFSHFSPTPGRRTPFDRMRLEGYEHGVSENIANHPGAESAHLGWVHSSGHHRNLLSATHTEFGVGNDGRLWVQNFGTGQDYRSDPDWSTD